MNIDYAIRKDEPPTLINTNTAADITLYEWWEWSSQLSMMFIKTRISAGIRGSVDQHEKVWDLLKVIDEQFITSDKVLASTIIMKFLSLKLTSMRGVSEHIMQIRDNVAQLKKLKGWNVGILPSALYLEHPSASIWTLENLIQHT